MALRTYGKLSLEKNFWVLANLEPHVCIKLKALFSGIPKQQSSKFKIANTPENCRDLEWFFDRYAVETTSEDRNLLEQGSHAFNKRVEDLEAIQRPDYVPRALPLKLPLRPYQTQAVDTYLKTQRLLVGDDVGLGKTPIAIATFCEPSTLPAAIVVQTHLPTQWREQIAKFTNLTVHLIKGTKPYSLPPADIYVFKYSCLAGWIDTFKLRIFKSVVFDEVQEIRLESSLKHAAAEELAKHADYCLGLSATPIYNYGNEIFNILNVIKPGCLGEWPAFSREWLGWDMKRVKDPKALGSYLRENFLMLRRTREETQQYLPPVNKIIHTVDYDAEAVASVQALAKQLATSVMSGTFVERGQAARELDVMVRQITGVSKAKYVAEYVRILLENGESVLLAGWHREVYDIWLKELEQFKPVMYTGTESPTQKEAAKKAFVSGESPLMIISLRSGVGLDGLQEKASLVVFGELDWSPAVQEQVIGRLQRDGQKSQVTAIFLVSETGSDPLMIDLLGLKASQAKGVLDPNDLGMTTQHSDEGRIKLLAERFLQKHE